MSRFSAVRALRQRGSYRNSSGFTLIELVIVFALLVILAGVALPAVQRLEEVAVRLKAHPPTAGVGNDTFQVVIRLKDSTQEKVMRVVTGAVAADPATGGLDQVALQSLYGDLLQREGELTSLMTQIAALLGTHLPPGERILLEDARISLAQLLDAVQKMKAVIQPRLSG